MSSFQEKSVAYFKEADVDGSGFLTMLEVYKVLKKNGCNASADEVCSWFRDIDKNKDDKVSLEEFQKVMSLRDPKDVTEMELRSVFQKIDKDNSGCITVAEFKQVLREKGVKCEIEKFNIEEDPNSDGKICFEEFLAMWRKC